MGEFATTHIEREYLGSGRFSDAIHMKAIAFDVGAGRLERIVPNFVAGDVNYPKRVDKAPFLTALAKDGGWRVCPDRNDPAKYIEFGAPTTKDAVVWQKEVLTPTTAISANTVQMKSARGLVWEVVHAGHYLKPTLKLPDGYNPTLLSFPVTLRGLDWKDGVLLADGKPLMHMRQPCVTDGAEDVRPITWELKDGRLILTLPDMKGMKSRVIDPTLVLQPNAADGKDTRIRSDNPTKNYGIDTALMGGVPAKGLIRFTGVSAIPSNAICQSAILVTTQSTGGGAALAWTVTNYSITAANNGWIEGIQVGVQALAGEPCWNARIADGAGGVTTAWAGSAGLSTAITDYEAAALGTFSGNQSDANGTQYTAALASSRVQGWFGTVNTNYGMLLVTSASIGNLASSDHATAAYRPMLTVGYELPTTGIWTAKLTPGTLVEAGLVKANLVGGVL